VTGANCPQASFNSPQRRNGVAQRYRSCQTDLMPSGAVTSWAVVGFESALATVCAVGFWTSSPWSAAPSLTEFTLLVLVAGGLGVKLQAGEPVNAAMLEGSEKPITAHHGRPRRDCFPGSKWSADAT
jgi:hypothetical protein